MSPKKLTIVVTCTHRKSVTPQHDLMARNLPSSDVRQRARVWSRALRRPQPTTPLIDLYRGESWGQVKRLIALAGEVGYDPSVLVASAGLGIRSVHEEAPAYAATFISGDEDSVAASRDDAREWWSTLPRVATGHGGRHLWVLSESYSRVIGTDLLEKFAADDLVVFGGSSEMPAHARVHSDRALRRALGGTVTSLNVRMAIQWLLLSRASSPFSARARNVWQDWSEQARYREEYGRQPLSDGAVIEFVATLKEQHPDISKTRALRSLRDSGLACEQDRFSMLYQKAVAR